MKGFSKEPAVDIIWMADFVFHEFNGEVKWQKYGTAIGTKFAPPYSRFFTDEVET